MDCVTRSLLQRRHEALMDLVAALTEQHRDDIGTVIDNGDGTALIAINRGGLNAPSRVKYQYDADENIWEEVLS